VRRNSGLLVINFRVFGSVVWSVKYGGQCGFRVAMPSPTIRPREQADLARYRSFVVSRCGFGFDVTGGLTACPVTAALPAFGRLNHQICGNKSKIRLN